MYKWHVEVWLGLAAVDTFVSVISPPLQNQTLLLSLSSLKNKKQTKKKKKNK